MKKSLSDGLSQRCHLPMAIGRSTDEAGDLPMDFQNLPMNEICETSKTSFFKPISPEKSVFLSKFCSLSKSTDGHR
jgi:hypothetical protein